MSKVHLYLERFWLIVAVILTIVTTIYMFQDGWKKSQLFWLLTGLTWGMFLFRRGVRKRMDKYHAANPRKNKKK